jgi:malate dehydrogenase (oxaloacetate-decarboxylating)(NADP+)
MSGLILPGRQVFLVDTHINIDPSAQELSELTLMAAREMRKLGLVPKVALLSHSNFGSSNAPSAVKMREVLSLVQKADPTLEVDGEMHGDSALDASIRAGAVTSSPLVGDANLLVLPNIDAANISYNLLKIAAGNGIAIGPLLLGVAKPIHILTPAATVRRIVNVTTLAVVKAASNARGTS